LVRGGRIRRLPPPFAVWTRSRDMRPIAPGSFVERHGQGHDRATPAANTERRGGQEHDGR
jgi:hypothetical protein